MHFAHSVQPSPPRGPKRELNKLVPVVFVTALISFLFASYYLYHLQPLIFSSDVSQREQGQIRSLLFFPVVVLLIFSYVQCVVVEPGFVPDTAEWQFTPENRGEQVSLLMMEKKRDGGLRHCKWCAKYKPDRAHHCRVLGRCVLKMDHHCPWIYNTIGFRNHKYFFLLLFYSMLALWFISLTMWETVAAVSSTESAIEETAFGELFIILFTETLASFMALVVTTFWLFHVWLMYNNMSTIEFCEKRTRPSSSSHTTTGEGTSDPHQSSSRRQSGPAGRANKFDNGAWANFAAALGGYNPLVWFIPGLAMPAHFSDGLSYLNDDTKLSVVLGTGRKLARSRPRSEASSSNSSDTKRLGGASKKALLQKKAAM